MCSAIIAVLIRSIRSLRTTSSSVATSEMPEANANLPQRIASRSSGRSPRTQKFRPSSERSGKMNRLVNVERIRRRHGQVEEADQVPPVRALEVIAQPADVHEVERQQAEEDQELRPLRWVAAEGPEVLQDQQADGVAAGRRRRGGRGRRTRTRRPGDATTAPPGPGRSPGGRGRGQLPWRSGTPAPHARSGPSGRTARPTSSPFAEATRPADIQRLGQSGCWLNARRLSRPPIQSLENDAPGVCTSRTARTIAAAKRRVTPTPSTSLLPPREAIRHQDRPDGSQAPGDEHERHADRAGRCHRRPARPAP